MTLLNTSRRRFGIVPRLLLLSPSLFFAASASSRLVNITVDDTFGDPITSAIPEYSPNNGWLAGFPSQNPATCNCHISTSVLDVTQVYNGTWHDATPLSSPATITVHFTGSAVYVFTILPNTLPVTITLANMSFSIDGEDVGAFVHSPEPGTSILYDQLVYHNTTLNCGPHTLVITPSGYSLILFDYLLYTAQGNDTNSSTSVPQLPSSTSPNSTPQSLSTSFNTSPSAISTNPDGSPQSSPSGAPTSTGTPDGSIPSSSRTRTPVGSIVGPVLGAIALLGVAVVALFLYRRHMRSKLDAEMNIRESKHGDDSARDEGRSGLGHRVGRDYQYSFSTLPSSATPASFPLDGARAHNLPDLASDSDGSRPSLSGADAGPRLPPAEGLANRPSLSELTRRLAALQRTMSTLSSQTPSRHARSEVSSEGGTETAIRELEAEIAQLRGALSALRVRLADGRGARLETLPVYA